MPAAGKRDAEAEQGALDWIEAVTGTKIALKNYEHDLKDGVILCNLMNKLAPGSVTKINTKGSNFVLMENHGRFLEAAKKYGLPDDEVFQTVDLFEARNIPQVTKCIWALGRITQKHPEYTGPSIGPKMADENKRDFSQEQLEAGKYVASQQMGNNLGATQAGINMGKQRMVLD